AIDADGAAPNCGERLGDPCTWIQPVDSPTGEPACCVGFCRNDRREILIGDPNPPSHCVCGGVMSFCDENDDCCSGVCTAGRCADRMFGAPCGDGGPCNEQQCLEGQCVRLVALGGACTSDAECGGRICLHGRCASSCYATGSLCQADDVCCDATCTEGACL